MAWFQYEAKTSSGAFELRKTLKRHKVHFVIDGQKTTYVREGGNHTSGQLRRGKTYGMSITPMAHEPPEFPTPCGIPAVSEEQARFHARGCKQCQQVKQQEAAMARGFSDGHAGVYPSGREPLSKFHQVPIEEAKAHVNGTTEGGIPLEALEAPTGLDEPLPETLTVEGEANPELLERLDGIENRALELASIASDLRNGLGSLAKMEAEIAQLEQTLKSTRSALAEQLLAAQKTGDAVLNGAHPK